MSSSSDDSKSPEVLQTQENSSAGSKRQKALEDQPERARKEALEILKNLNFDPATLSVYSNSAGAKAKRIPYLYSINNNQSILVILQGDITKTKVDAIVNAANEHMTGGGGVDGIIHDAAGPELYNACKAHKQIERGVRLPTGHSRILLSYDMSKTTYYIINTAGPVYNRYRDDQCAEDLTSCYKTALALAGLYDLESIGFTAISCGIFGYPVNDGADVALRTVDKEAGPVPVVVFVLWDNHIYDAWIRKAKELNFTPFDPKDLLAEKPSTPSAASTEQEKTDPILSTDEPSVNETEELVLRLPSVPHDVPHTQNMDSPDTEQTDSNIEKPSLTSQKTAEMTDVEREKENVTTSTDNSSSHPDETAPIPPTNISKLEDYQDPN